MACNLDMPADKTGNIKPVTYFTIDWNSNISLRNWMTCGGLICEDPVKLGFLGMMSFFSFAIGSVFFGKVADKFGRKYSVFISSVVSPICFVILANVTFNLKLIYSLSFIMGLGYSTRSSVSYMFATEFMCDIDRIHYAKWLFIFVGFFKIFSCYFFMSISKD